MFKKIVSLIFNKKMIFDIVAILFAIYVVFRGVATIGLNSYIVNSDFYNEANSSVNHYGLLVPFYLNLFAFGQLKSDPTYYCSNVIIELVISTIFIISVFLEMLNLKKRDYFTKTAVVFSYVIFKLINTIYYYSVGHILFTNSSLIFISIFSLLAIFYICYCIYHIYTGLSALDHNEKSQVLVNRIKVLSLVAVSYVILIVISKLTDQFFLNQHGYYFLGNRVSLSGFSKIYKELIYTPLGDRMPSFWLIISSVSLLEIIVLVIFTILFKKQIKKEAPSDNQDN